MAEEIIKVKVDLDVSEFSKNAKAMSDALSKVLGKEIELFNGRINKTTKLVGDTEKALGGTASAVNKAGNAVKQSNQQWTNFALVIQDLPYGFRGIQNNLPALIGGFASLTGPIYLAGSALIAFFTAWDQGLFSTKKKIDVLKESQSSYLDSLKQSTGSAVEEISKIKALTNISKDHTISMDKRLIAVKELQKEYPAYFGNLSQEEILNGKVKTAVDEVSSAILARAKATAIAAKINSLSAEKFAMEERLYQLALIKTSKVQGVRDYVKKMQEAGFDETGKHIKGLISAQVGSIRDEENVIKSSITNIVKELDRLTKSYEESVKASIGLLYDPQKGKEKPKEKPKKEAVQYFDLTKAVDDYYNAKLDFATEDNRAQLEILKQQQTTYDDMLSNNLISTIKWYDKTSDLYKQMYQLTLRIREQESRDAERFANDRVKNVEAQLDTELKIHRKSIILQRQDIEKAMASVAVMAATSFDASAINVFLKKFDELSFKLQALPDAARLFAEEFNSILSQTLVGGFSEIGNQLANVLSTGNFEFGGILGILADALIQVGKALILYSSLVQAAKKALESGNLEGAIPLGILAIAAGTALKNSINKKRETGVNTGEGVKAFANGGIISGPTYGLMGEYPGAKANPEVVAPLDKLKDMIGGGNSGQFVLKGQDLVLAMTRSEKSLNLRRG